MTRILFAVGTAALLVATAQSADQKYALTGENTTITFVGKKPDGKHAGGFKKLSGTATVADGNPTTLAIEVEIDTASLYSDDPKLTAHLKAPDFFSVKDNPKATFKTTKVEKSETGFTITGDLTMLGKTKAISFPAAITAGDALTLTSEFKIDRTAWGMTYSKGKIDDEAALKLVINAKK